MTPLSRRTKQREREPSEQTSERVEPLPRVPVAYFRAGQTCESGNLGPMDIYKQHLVGPLRAVKALHIRPGASAAAKEGHGAGQAGMATADGSWNSRSQRGWTGCPWGDLGSQASPRSHKP